MTSLARIKDSGPKANGPVKVAEKTMGLSGIGHIVWVGFCKNKKGVYLAHHGAQLLLLRVSNGEVISGGIHSQDAANETFEDTFDSFKEH